MCLGTSADLSCYSNVMFSGLHVEALLHLTDRHYICLSVLELLYLNITLKYNRLSQIIQLKAEE